MALPRTADEVVALGAAIRPVEAMIAADPLAEAL